MIYTTDDVCPSNLKYFEYWERVKEKKPDLRLIAFTIANFNFIEPVDASVEFRDWFNKSKDWVEVAVHGFDHTYPPEAERDDFEDCVEEALRILKPFLPEKYGYRSPGFKFTIRMEPVLKKLGFSYVAYGDRIKYFNGGVEASLYNTHCCDRYANPITKVWKALI